MDLYDFVKEVVSQTTATEQILRGCSYEPG